MPPVSYYYSSKLSFSSPTIPGVSYTLRKMSHGRRVKLNSSVSPIIAEINEIQQQLIPIDEEIKRAEEAAKISPCSCSHDPLLQEKETDPPQHNIDTGRCIVPGCNCRKPEPDPTIGDYMSRTDKQLKVVEIVTSKLYPAYIRWAVSAIQGLEIDDQPATVETLIEDGPEALVLELGEEIQKMIRLSPDEVQGFKSPTTSDGQVAGQTPNTTAPSVNETNSTSPATAASSSQS